MSAKSTLTCRSFVIIEAINKLIAVIDRSIPVRRDKFVAGRFDRFLPLIIILPLAALAETVFLMIAFSIGRYTLMDGIWTVYLSSGRCRVNLG